MRGALSPDPGLPPRIDLGHLRAELLQRGPLSPATAAKRQPRPSRRALVGAVRGAASHGAQGANWDGRVPSKRCTAERPLLPHAASWPAPICRPSPFSAPSAPPALVTHLQRARPQRRRLGARRRDLRLKSSDLALQRRDLAVKALRRGAAAAADLLQLLLSFLGRVLVLSGLGP
jgi:hypothetical protein